MDYWKRHIGSDTVFDFESDEKKPRSENARLSELFIVSKFLDAIGRPADGETGGGGRTVSFSGKIFLLSISQSLKTLKTNTILHMYVLHTS